MKTKSPDLMVRGWINQPSKLQTLHKYHGKSILFNPNEGESVTIYFTEGAVISALVSRNCLSLGWLK